jgi:hypothetical protein
MGMPEAQTGWTVAMLDALPEGIERHEIIDGERFVTPAPGEAHHSSSAGNGNRPAYPYHIRDLLLAIEVAVPATRCSIIRSSAIGTSAKDLPSTGSSTSKRVTCRAGAIGMTRVKC